MYVVLWIHRYSIRRVEYSLCRYSYSSISNSLSSSVTCNSKVSSCSNGKVTIRSINSSSINRGTGKIFLLSKGSGVFGALGQGVDLYDCNKYKKIEFFDNYNSSINSNYNGDSINNNNNLFVDKTTINYNSSNINSINMANNNNNNNNLNNDVINSSSNNSIDNNSFKSIAAGWGHSAVITGNGDLYIFGRPYDFSSLLRIEQINRFSSMIARYISSSSNSFIFGNGGGGIYPLPIDIQTINNTKSVSCSAGLTCILTNNGEIYCFGLNRWGQCGFKDDSNDHIFHPKKVEGIPSCSSIDTGLQHCIVLTTDGLIYTWGKASKGQLGILHGNNDDNSNNNRKNNNNNNNNEDKHILPPSATPTQVILPPRLVRDNGSVINSGSNNDNNKGKYRRKNSKRTDNDIESSSSSTTTTTITTGVIESIKAMKVSAGFAHSAALSVDGFVYVWGRGMSLECRQKSFLAGTLYVCDDQKTPRLVELPDGRKAIDICSSYFNVVILAEDRSLWTIGMGEYDRNANPLPLPVQVAFKKNPSEGNNNLDDDDAGDDEGDGHKSSSSIIKSYVQLPEGAIMRKGHQRVTIFIQHTTSDVDNIDNSRSGSRSSSNSGSSSIGNINHSSSIIQEAYEIMIHKGEAYLIDLDVDLDMRLDDNQNKQYKVIDQASGWKHSLLLVEELL